MPGHLLKQSGSIYGSGSPGAAGGGGALLPYEINPALLADGALPTPWSAPSWNITTGNIVGTPVLATSLITNSDFEANITGWSALNTPATLERNTTTPIAGTGDLHLLDTENKNTAAIWTAGLAVTAGHWYEVKFTARKVGTRTATVCVSDNNGYANTASTVVPASANVTTSNATYTFVVRCTTTTTVYPKVLLNNELSTRELYVDDFTVKDITVTSMWAAYMTQLTDVSLHRAAWTVVAETTAGVFGWWDGAVLFQNCILAYHTGTRVKLEKYVGSTKTTLVDLAITYVSGREVEIRRGDGTNLFEVWYNGKQVGTTQTISDVEIVYNRYFGLLSGSASNQCSSVRIESVDKLPVWGVDMTRNAGNPLITTTLTSTGGTVAADPYLFTLDGITLYVLFESTTVGGVGQIWMAQSTDGVVWTDPVKVSADDAKHYAHPHVFVDGAVHLYMQQGSGSKVQHRSSPVAGFPDWSAEGTVFDVATQGWTGMNECAIFLHSDGNYYMLGITQDGSAVDDKWLRGMYCATLPSNWNTEATEITAGVPILAVSDFAWLDTFVEITQIQSGGRLLLMFGAARSGIRAISTYEVASLDSSGITGRWRENGWTFGIGVSGAWDATDIHRASACYFGGRWVYAYDGVPVAGTWSIGFATRP